MLLDGEQVDIQEAPQDAQRSLELLLVYQHPTAYPGSDSYREYLHGTGDCKNEIWLL